MAGSVPLAISRDSCVGVGKPLALILPVTVGILSVGCPQGIDITFDNRTKNDVLVQVNDGDRVNVTAASTRTFSFLTDNVDQFDITVMTEDGRVLFHEVFTEDELEERDNRIIIEDPSSRRPLLPEATNALPP